MSLEADDRSAWPSLEVGPWQETARTLHLWSQVVGKVQLELAPMINHWWQVPLRVTSRGLATGLIHSGSTAFEVELDLRQHGLEVRSSDGGSASWPFPRMSTLAGFSSDFFKSLRALGLEVEINPRAVEIPEKVFLDRDTAPRHYDSGWAGRLFQALLTTHRVFEAFRADFLGKASPVHFFWGSFDLCVSRFSGRRAPRHPGGAPNCPTHVMEEAYSHEVCSAGFWPGNADNPEAMFFSYVYPEPPGYREARVVPSLARFHPVLREFVLPWEAVRISPSPEATLRAFLESTWEAAATFGHWDRSALERGHDRGIQLEAEHGLPL